MRRRREPRVVMVMLVRDEHDVIALNIRFHASRGIAAFVVIDNDSADGTYEIVQGLATEYDIVLQRRVDDRFRQSRWMTEGALLAYARLGADLVVLADADEFWMPEDGGTFAAAFDPAQALVSCERLNMLVPAAAPFHRAMHCVVNPVAFSRRSQLEASEISVGLLAMRDKCMVDPRGLLRVGQGNHSALHTFHWRAVPRASGLTIYHYPIRSFAQFARSVELYRRLLHGGAPRLKVGALWRRWAELADPAAVAAEYRRLSFGRADLALLQRVGIVETREAPARALARLVTANRD
ncbi:MAG: glycosyltransferase family 2 protein [Gammaproteobacteria bacterium]|nr:glycosyltransferase family 2 protein [Gammaproteobacteria bacterium]MCP5200306.1 glycosyltransferase family 2 protein [Gammaproteobacteria bacterium]